MPRTLKDSKIEWVGLVPDGWQVKRNKVCFDCSKEIVGKNSFNTQLLSLTTQGIKKKRPEESTGKVPESYDTYQIVNPNDIVMCLFDLDVSAVFSGISLYEGMISPAYKVLKCKTDRVLPSYADYWFSFVFDGRKFKHYSKNLRYTLNYDEFAALPILLPRVEEQKRIVTFLNSQCAHIDTVIERTKESIEEYRKLKQAIITQAVTKGIRGDRPMKDSGVEWIGKINDMYGIFRLKQVLSSELKYGANESGVPYDDGLPRYIRITDIALNGQLKQSGMLSLTEEQAEGYILSDNDILLARSGATVGKAFIYKSEYGRSAFAGYLIRASVDTQKMLPEYLFLYTQSSIYEEWKKQIFVQATIQNIGADRYSNLPIIVPSIEEQSEIVNHLQRRCREIERLLGAKNQLIDDLEQYKKSLIYEYVTGKKEVPEYEC